MFKNILIIGFGMIGSSIARSIPKSRKQAHIYAFDKSKDFSTWYKSWKKELNVVDVSKEMNLKNPCYIPRNHLIEDALMNAVGGDMKEINLMANQIGCLKSIK